MSIISRVLLVVLVAVFLAGPDASGQGMMVNKLIEQLDSRKPSDVREAYNRLLLKGEEAVPYLIATLEDPFQSTSVRVSCASLLGELRVKEAIPGLIEAMDSRQMRLRYTAATALGNVGDKSAVPALVKALGDQDITVQEHVISAIRKIGDVTAGPALVKVLQYPEPSTRLLATETLVDFKTKEAVPAFMGILEGSWDTREVRVLAAKGLGEIAGNEAVDLLSQTMLKDPDPVVRAQCAASLGVLGNKKAIPSLVKALNDEYKDVVLNASDSLSKITGRPATYDVAAWRDWYETSGK